MKYIPTPTNEKDLASYYAARGYSFSQSAHLSTPTAANSFSQSDHLPTPTAANNSSQNQTHYGPGSSLKSGIGIGLGAAFVIGIVLILFRFFFLRRQRHIFRAKGYAGPAAGTHWALPAHGQFVGSEPVEMSDAAPTAPEIDGRLVPAELENGGLKKQI